MYPYLTVLPLCVILVVTHSIAVTHTCTCRILYERLAAVPPTPGRQVQDLPPEEDPAFTQQPPAPAEHAPVIDPNDRALVEYIRTHPNAQIVQAPDGRVIAVEDNPPPAAAQVGPAGAPANIAVRAEPPHGLPLVYGFRHDSGPGYDPNRQLPPLPPMIPILQVPEKTPELPPINDPYAHPHTPYSQPPPPQQAGSQSQNQAQVQSQAQAQATTRTHGHTHSNSSSHHSRASSARPDLDTLAQGNLQSLPPVHVVHSSRSPSMPDERHAVDNNNNSNNNTGSSSRSRRHDIQELTHPPSHTYPPPPPPPLHMSASPSEHSSQQSQGQGPPLSPTSGRSPAYSRNPSRIHAHQRIGPGTNINREPLYDSLRHGDADTSMDERDERWARDEHDHDQSLSGPGGSYKTGSRSRSPVASMGGGRSSSRTYAEREPEYEEEEEEAGAGSGPGASASAAAPGPSAEITNEQQAQSSVRKASASASRGEMEVDDEDGASGSLMDNRAAKRVRADSGGGNHESGNNGSGNDSRSGNGSEVPDERMDEDV